MKDDKRELYQQAQHRLVASLLVDSDKTTRVLELITEDDIEEPSYRLIFSCISELSRLNETISHLSVAVELERRGVLKEAGGTRGLYELSVQGENFLLDSPPQVYAQIVKESSAKSKVSRALQESFDNFKDGSGVQAADAVSELQSMLNESLVGLSDSSTISNVKESFDDYLELLAERKRISEENDNDGLQGIPSLLPTLNKYTTGWLPGQLITVGARTGIGKSAFAVNCAIAAAQANSSVMFFSLEMSRTEIEDRVLSATTGIPMNQLKQGDLNAEENARLRTQMTEMADMKLTIDVEPKVTVDVIRARAQNQAQTTAGLDFIIIDYLQLITPNGKFGSRQEAVADVSRNMKLLAKQLNVPIMVLVQLTREGKDDENSLPKMSQIRESGAIAQDSDIVVLIHREKSLDDTTHHTLVILEKNRNGEAEKLMRCHTNLECSLFREVKTVSSVEQQNASNGEMMTEEDFDELSDEMDLSGFDEDSDFDGAMFD